MSVCFLRGDRKGVDSDGGISRRSLGRENCNQNSLYGGGYLFSTEKKRRKDLLGGVGHWRHNLKVPLSSFLSTISDLCHTCYHHVLPHHWPRIKGQSHTDWPPLDLWAELSSVLRVYFRHAVTVMQNMRSKNGKVVSTWLDRLVDRWGRRTERGKDGEGGRCVATKEQRENRVTWQAIRATHRIRIVSLIIYWMITVHMGKWILMLAHIMCIN